MPPFRRFKFNTIFYWIDGRMYHWTGWFGCQLESWEWFRVHAGTQRTLAGECFTVFRSEREGLKWRTTWAMRLPDGCDAANAKLRGFKQKLAGMKPTTPEVDAT